MEIEAYGILLVPLILGLIEIAKGTGLPTKWSPVLAVSLGILLGVLILYPENLGQGVIVGIGLGLSATGLYSGTKNVKEVMRR